MAFTVRTTTAHFISLLGVSLVSGSLLLSGCSFSTSSQSSSDSSGSSSDSASSPFASSSEGSADDKSEGYQNEVAARTTIYVSSASATASSSQFQRQLSEIAAGYGISNWEAQSDTYNAVGVGLKKARVTRAQYDAFKRSFASSDPGKMDDIQQGYDATR